MFAAFNLELFIPMPF